VRKGEISLFSYYMQKYCSRKCRIELLLQNFSKKELLKSKKFLKQSMS